MELALQRLAEADRALAQLLGMVEQAARILEQARARRGEAQALGVMADEEIDLEPVLERRKPRAGRCAAAARPR